MAISFRDARAITDEAAVDGISTELIDARQTVSAAKEMRRARRESKNGSAVTTSALARVSTSEVAPNKNLGT